MMMVTIIVVMIMIIIMMIIIIIIMLTMTTIITKSVFHLLCFVPGSLGCGASCDSSWLESTGASDL